MARNANVRWRLPPIEDGHGVLAARVDWRSVVRLGATQRNARRASGQSSPSMRWHADDVAGEAPGGRIGALCHAARICCRLA